MVGGIRPATAAQGTRHVGLWAAYGIHLFCAIVAVNLIIAFIAAAQFSEPLTVGRVLKEWGDLVEGILDEFDRNPKEALLIVLAIVGTAEVAFLLLAFIVMPWGSRDERWTTSFRSALVWTWLSSAMVLAGVFAVGSLSVMHSRAESAHWQSSAVVGPDYPIAPAAQPRGSAAWKAYEKEVEAYNQQWQEMWDQRLASRPGFVKAGPYLICSLVLTWLSWWLWGVFRGVGSDRSNEKHDRPPMCEACGYNLTATPMEGRCPECGGWVVQSLGSDVRPGCVWERRRDLGWVGAWGQTSMDAVLRPMLLGRQISTTRRVTDHRLFALMHLPIVFGLGYASLVASYILETRDNPFTSEPQVGFMVAPIFGFIVTMVALGLPLVAAGVTASLHWRERKRNLMAASLQIASYMSGFATFWAAISGALGVFVLSLDKAFREWGRALGVDPDILAFTDWAIPNGLALGFYLVQVYRGTAAARYANS
jgi:ABC-type tungstate transport system substrate-binding protein